MKLFIYCFLMLFMSMSLFSSPTINGPSGLITMPVAHSLYYKEFSLSYDYINRIHDPNRQSENWFYSFNLGTFENVELGIVGNQQLDEGVFLNAKYFIFSEAQRFPLTFAAGFENLSSKSLSNFYLVVSKSLNKRVSLHGGFKSIFAEEINPKFMAGFEYFYFQNLSILADINGKYKVYKLNAGLKWVFYQKIELRMHYLDILNAGKDRNLFGAGLAYRKFI